jgi:hypothetical protein
MVIAALLVLQNYMRRGVAGRLKASTDEIGKQFDTTGNYTTAYKLQSAGNTTTTEARAPGGVINTSIANTSETVTRSEYETWGNQTTAQHY